MEVIKEWISTGIIPDVSEMIPWYRGFKGKIEKDTEKPDRFLCWGCVSRTKDYSTYTITELPATMVYEDGDIGYRKFLNTLKEEEKILDYKYAGTTEDIKIILEMGNDFRPNRNDLKLRSYIHTSNMVLFGEKGGIKKYTLAEIFENFCEVRLKYYIKRKKYVLEKLEMELKMTKGKYRFISEILFNDLTDDEKTDSGSVEKFNIKNVTDDDVESLLEERGYDKDLEGKYNYLLNISVRGLTKNKIEVLTRKIGELIHPLKHLWKRQKRIVWLKRLVNLRLNTKRFMEMSRFMVISVTICACAIWSGLPGVSALWSGPPDLGRGSSNMIISLTPVKE